MRRIDEDLFWNTKPLHKPNDMEAATLLICGEAGDSFICCGQSACSAFVVPCVTVSYWRLHHRSQPDRI
jgi:hypothetical protein